jgi:hypothetical protein
VRSEEAREIGAVCDFTVVPGVVHGLRGWQLFLEGSRPRLGSLNWATIWAPGEATEAICVSPRPEDDPLQHRSPSAACACGIYAQHPFGDPAEAFGEWLQAPVGGACAPVGLTVCGVISAWGRVEVSFDGFRAEYALPAALLTMPDWRGTPYERSIRELAAEYGIPTVEIEDVEQLIEVCGDRWPGLTEDLVEDLLIDELEVVLTPFANLFIPDEGPVAGAGYVLEGNEYRPWPWDAQWKIEQRGARVVRVAGTKYTREAIQSDAFAPGRTVQLVAEPENRHDTNAVAIYDEAGELRAGYLPRSLAPEIGRELRDGRVGRAIVVWHWRDLASGRRVGLCVLVARRRLPIVIAA